MITVIVMLILAAISITMLTGDNSILKRAGEAKNRTELSSLKEEAQVVMLNRVTEKTTSGSNTKTLKEDLESGISGGQVEEIIKADGTTKYTDVCYVSKNGQSITVYENGEVEEGKVSIWKGATDIECPKYEKDEKNIWNWYIYTPSQLKFLADFVNNGNKLEGRDDLKKLVEDANYDTKTVTMSTDTTIYLMNNLDLGARTGDGTNDEEKWTTNPDTLKWMPIGIDSNNVQDKLGTFEGNNYSICGVYVNRENSYNGIFGNSNKIQNLTIKNSFIQGKSETGGIVGDAYGTIENCHNKNTTISLLEEEYLYNGGGIVAMINGTGSISNCSNNGKLLAEKCNNVGGIVGYAPSTITITGCNNSSNKIIGKTNVGGITGHFLGVLTNCNNYGEVKGISEVGGIIGFNRSTHEVSDCTNKGRINGNINIGGIVGFANNSAKIIRCNNGGTIFAITGNNVGGIVGVSESTISGCNNSGAITGTDGVGGIAGVAKTITKCSNTGNISGTETTGGIVGSTEKGVRQDISLCYNSGEVKGANTVGGISGYLGAKDQKGKEYKCYNKGKVINTSNANSTGGIVGKMATDASVTNCYYLSSIGVDRGIGTINTQEQNDGAQPTEKDINSFEEFITWIEQQNT